MSCSNKDQSTCIPEDDCKVFNDSVHGHIEVPILCTKIMDTMEFQRLRQIKQLGGCYYVFPGASHNRFEHSIGVSHLAGKLARKLQQKQPELEITHEDILCVEIAGLCHDLGHGPFSHLFDGLFIPRVQKEGADKWTHEQASLDMFDYLMDKNGLEEVFKKHGLVDIDIKFVKEQIYGILPGKTKYEGRPEEKHFLYEIVSNKRTGIDVDKWDYFARDCLMLGISNSFDYNRFLMFARVIKVDGKYLICTREQEVGNLYNMFHTRNSLHRSSYQHKVSKIIEEMITEALVSANDHFEIKGKDGKKIKISEAINDMEAYAKLTDNILYQLLESEIEELKPSQELIRNIFERKLYKCVGQTNPKDKTPGSVDVIKEELANCVKYKKLIPSDFVVLVAKFNYGDGDKDPIENMRFYSKKNPDEAFKIEKEQFSQMLPKNFSEQIIRVYCKSRDKVEAATECFEVWCANNGFNPLAGNLVLYDTPRKSSPTTEYPNPGSTKRSLFE